MKVEPRQSDHFASPGEPHYVQGALVNGWAAYAFARVLHRHWGVHFECLPSSLLRPCKDALAALDQEATRWRGSAEARPAEVLTQSELKDGLSSEEAAHLLQVTNRRVRQLAAIGQLPGQKVKGVWQFDSAAVMALQQQRSLK